VTEQNRQGKTQSKTKTIFFDYENEWKVKTSTNGEIQIDDPRFSSQIENELQLPPAPLPTLSSQEATDCLSQDDFESDFSIGSIQISSLS
jgi:hypothetical protein